MNESILIFNRKGMKKLLLLLALIGVSATQSEAETVGDTLVIENVGKVTIETDSNVQHIVMKGSKENADFLYDQRIEYSDSSAFKRTVKTTKKYIARPITKTKNVEANLHFLFGFSTMLNAPSDYSFSLWPSFEWSFGGTIDWTPFGKRNVWSTGLMFDWRNYRLNDDKYFGKNSSNEMQLLSYGVGDSDKKSTMVAFSLQVPLLYTHNFDKKGKWHVTLGALVNFNTGAHTTRQYIYNDEDYEVKTTGIGQRPVTVDGYLELGIPSFPDLYVKYSPNTYFKDGRGPKMHQLSFGLSLF